MSQRLWHPICISISPALGENHDALLAAYRAQDWSRARELLGRCRLSDRHDLDKLYDLFAARIEDYSTNPLMAVWNVVHVAQNK